MPHQMKQESKKYNKTKSCKSFWNAKCYEFYIYRWIYSQHNYQRYMQLPKQEWKNDNYINHWTWQILTATVFYSTHDVHKFIGEQTVFWFYDQLKWFYIKMVCARTCTHTQNIYTVNSSTNATTINISFTKIEVYSYRRAHTYASCTAGVICRGCGVQTCNTQPST